MDSFVGEVVVHGIIAPNKERTPAVKFPVNAGATVSVGDEFFRCRVH